MLGRGEPVSWKYGAAVYFPFSTVCKVHSQGCLYHRGSSGQTCPGTSWSQRNVNHLTACCRAFEYVLQLPYLTNVLDERRFTEDPSLESTVTSTVLSPLYAGIPLNGCVLWVIDSTCSRAGHTTQCRRSYPCEAPIVRNVSVIFITSATFFSLFRGANSPNSPKN